MKKHLALVMAALMMASMLAGCGSSDTSNTGSGDGNSEGYNTLNIIAAHGAAENTSENESFLKFKELVEDRSGGAITVDLYPNQQLGGDREYTEAATQGNVTMGGPSTANIAPFVPALNAFETPFLFSDRESVYAALDSDAGQALLDSLESSGRQPQPPGFRRAVLRSAAEGV